MKRQYDVIIVGCGVAGCFTALHLPKDRDILMITKSDLEESDSFLAQGGICVLKNDEDYDSFYEDTMRAGHYENRPESVDIMIRSSREVINELIQFGVDFARENGELVYTREGAHSTNRILYHDDVTGKEITSKLLAEVKTRENITIMTQTAMVDILCRENCCDGILVKTKAGELQPVFAQHVMWACGGIGGIYENSTNFPHLTGDALALSLRHNVRLQNVNYVQIHPTTLYSKKKERRFLISESVRGEGAHLYDKNGNRFVDELLPRDILTQEIRKQMKKDGTDYVWLSMLPIQDMDVRVRFPNIYRKCLEEGYDVTKEWIPVVPAQHYFMGGVYVDRNSHTSMKHLYASGETCCNGVHGANRLASNSLLESLVFAKNAAFHMAKVDEEDKKKPHKPRFEDYVNLSIKELAKVYQLFLEEYDNLEEFYKNNKEKIWEEIRREQEKQK
ncbi:MAG: L-aspartate oxidase [Lachnospiraceae bacterium]|nr:L-aspartate oxidase [Lachnospiraceae bacterium]